MNTLFPVSVNFPEGFYYFPEFLSEAEEKDLFEKVANVQLQSFFFQGFEAKRKIASFGYDYNFEKQSISPGKEIPSAFNGVIEKVAAHLSIPKSEFAELLITEYPVGSVINWHRDAPPFDLIAGISLHADCTFRLRPYEKAKQSRASVISFPVKKRSLYVISGTSRTDWQHSIAAVKDVRYSITLRTLRGKAK